MKLRWHDTLPHGRTPAYLVWSSLVLENSRHDMTQTLVQAPTNSAHNVRAWIVEWGGTNDMAVGYALNVSVLDTTISRRHERMCEVVWIYDVCVCPCLRFSKVCRFST